MRTDGQMDMTKLIVAFRNFANARKHVQFTVCSVKAYKDSRGIVALMLNLGTRYRYYGRYT